MILDHLAILIETYFGYVWYGSAYYTGAGDAFSHFCYTWATSQTVRPIIHNIVLVFFFGISGISGTFSHSNLRRGAGLMALALIYSFCTLFVEEVMDIAEVTTTFGVLHFLATCMLMHFLVDIGTKRDPYKTSLVAVGIIGIVLILYFCYTPPEGTSPIFGIIFPPYDVHGVPTFYSQSELSPGDLFSLVPYTAYFFLGVAVAPFLYGKRKSLLPRLDGKWNKPVCFIGKHALLIYLLHVALMALLLALITFIFITPGDFPL